MNKRIRNIYISVLRVVALTLCTIPVVLHGQDTLSALCIEDTVGCIEDLEYQERAYNKSYDSVLVSYFYQRNTKHIENKHYTHDAVESCSFDDIPDSVFFERLNAIPAVIPMSYNSTVRAYIKMYVRKMERNLNGMLSLAEYYFPFFDQALERYNLPHELKYLPIIESALNPQAVSRVGATGLWQFMSGTAKISNLNINSLVDERKDPLKSSDAAARYLRDLYNIFGDWHLAIAAYNCGPKNINKAVARSGGKTNFWEIYRYLPKETRGYIPAYIAAAYVMNHYEKHGLRPDAVDVPIETDTLMIDKNVFFAQITKFLPIDSLQLKVLNPQYKEELIPGATSPCCLRLPMEHIPTFIRLQDSIYAYGKDSLVQQMVQEIQATETIIHKVRKNETLSKLARRYGVTVEQIRKWNPKLKRNAVLRIGQKITIQRKNPLYRQIKQKAPQMLEKKEEKKSQVTAVDTAKVQTNKIGTNEQKSDNVKTKSDVVKHTVKKGETLGGIANRHHTTVKKLKQLNNLKSDKIKVGQVLRVK